MSPPHLVTVSPSPVSQITRSRGKILALTIRNLPVCKRLCPHSSVDRALASGARDGGSSPPGGARNTNHTISTLAILGGNFILLRKTAYNIHMLRRLLSLWFATALVISACGTKDTIPALVPAVPDWSSNDLRYLDPAEAFQPSVDLIAAYTRLDGNELDIRLDLLDLAEIPDQDLYIALDYFPGGTTELPFQAKTSLAWDTLLVVSAHRGLQAVSPDTAAGQFRQRPHSGLRVQRNPSLDTITVSLNQAAIWSIPATLQNMPDLRIEVISTLAGSSVLADRLGPFNLTTPPPSPARTLLAFWNSLPAYTPLQALRRWDGAHTGPLGGRHGLYNLLRTARNTGTPVFLLDLNQPAMLSALDTLDGTGLVREMANEGLLGLPAVLPGFPDDPNLPALLQPSAWALERMLQQSSQITHDFGIESNLFIFIPSGLRTLNDLSAIDKANSGRIAFLTIEGESPSGEATDALIPVWPAKWEHWLVLPVPGHDTENGSSATEQATLDGPSLAVRRVLIATAHAVADVPVNQASLLILGGDLPVSDWGIPEAARATLNYMQKHPWVQFLGPADLKRLSPARELDQNSIATPAMPGTEDRILLEGLRLAPANSLGAAAWEAYQAAFTPTYPIAQDLPALRAIYAHQVGILLEGARWAESPRRIASCDLDPDGDGRPECILASAHVFAAFELDSGGYLAYLFVVDGAGEAHQIIAPSGLLSNGTSPADTWNLNQGVMADPQTLPGAFWDVDSPVTQPAQAELDSDSIRLSISGKGLVKTFHLLPDGIQASFTGLSKGDNYRTSLSIALDPWLRFQPGWVDRYTSQMDGGSWTWGSQAGPRIEIQTNAAISPTTFIDELQLLEAPEDPNRELPAGFRLPFPLAEVTLNAKDDFSASIRLVK